MYQRNPVLDVFLQTLYKAIKAQAPATSRVQEVTDRVMEALKIPGEATADEAEALPVCALLDEMCDDVDAYVAENENSSWIDTSVSEHARAMQQLSPLLAWWRRPDADRVGEPFTSGHANATIVGPKALERRNDVWVGITLLAPGVSYPVHRHAPEEVYLVLSEGQWQRDHGRWHEPGIGGIVHNPPDVLHAMRSGPRPLLATWCLWVG